MTQTAQSPYQSMSKSALIEIIENQKLAINHERARRKQVEDALSNAKLPLNLRLAVIASKRLEETSRPDEDGYYRVHLPALADMVGVSASTISRGLRNLADCTEAIEHTTRPKADEPYKDIVFIRPTDLLDRPQDIKPLKEIKRHGGDHRVARCNGCGSENIIEKRYQVCGDCGQVYKTFEDRAINEPLQDAMGTVEQEEIESVQHIAHLDEPLQDATFTTNNHTSIARCNDSFPIEDFLQRRIGHGPIIYHTGSQENTEEHPKYYTKPLEYVPNIDAYLAGKLSHVYGSRPARPDGTTYLLGFDIEDPHLDKSHTYMMFRLASAGIASVYWKRREGRGHLEVYTDAPVDRKAFYAHVVRVCPDLAAVPECFPIGSDQNTKGEDRSDFGYSWPLFYRVGNKVIESSAEFMFPDRPGEIVSSKGYKSDLAGLTFLLSRSIVASESIPALRIVQPAPAQEIDRAAPVLLLESFVCSDSGCSDLLVEALKAWNRLHSWDEVIELCGGLQKNKHFLAVWRGERTASVKVDSDNRYACDYGKHGDFPKKLDKFGVWCLAQGLDHSSELYRLVDLYRLEQQEQERRAS